MANINIQEDTRLDHYGIVTGVIRDLGIRIFYFRTGSRSEDVSAGNPVASMIVNGLGISDRPLSLTPQFFEQLPVEHLLEPSVSAEKLNRYRFYTNNI